MKARDRQTGLFKKVFVKALDSLPVGSEIDFDGNVSNIPVGWEQTTDVNSYSTDEIKTNKTWIDGKPIYRKVINFTNKSISSGDNNLATGISNMETLTDSKLYMKYDNTWFADWAESGFVNKTYTNNGSNYQVYCNSGLTAQQLILITEYTKTTD